MEYLNLRFGDMENEEIFVNRTSIKQHSSPVEKTAGKSILTWVSIHVQMRLSWLSDCNEYNYTLKFKFSLLKTKLLASYAFQYCPYRYEGIVSVLHLMWFQRLNEVVM